MTIRCRKMLAASACALALLSPAVVVARVAAAPLIVIDPGHGGPYSNANANGLREKNVNLAIGLELRRQLVARGYRVAMTRTTDRAVSLSDISTWNWSSSSGLWSFKKDGKRGIQSLPKDDLQARADRANHLGADLFISIHNNGSVNRSVRGTETFASSKDRLGRSLAAIVHKRIVSRTGLVDRGAKTSDFYVCRWTNMPALLVEGAFITNASDARLLKQSTFRRRMAAAIAEGVDTWFDQKPFTRTSRRISTGNESHAAAAVSRYRFKEGSDTVVVARSASWADVPGAPGLAAKLKAPLLWTGASGPNTTTRAEITRLAPKKIILLGVKGSFNETATIESLAAAASLETSSVVHISAAGRSRLAVSIARSMTSSRPTRVFVLDKDDTNSMLAAVPVAAAFRIPVFLSAGDVLTPEARTFLSGKDLSACTVVLVGRSAALSTAATRSFATVKRVRSKALSTAARSLNDSFYRAPSVRPVVASYRSGSEYYTAAVYSAPSKRPVVPVAGRVLPDQSRLWITNARARTVSFEVFDGRKTIPTSMEHMLRKADRE